MATYTITNDTVEPGYSNGIFTGFFAALTAAIQQSYAQGVTMELSAPGSPNSNNAALLPLSSGQPVQASTLYPSGGAIVAGTAQPAPSVPTITVSSSGGTNNRFAITNDTNGFFAGYFAALTAFINEYYSVSITMELSAPGNSPGAPVQNFSSVKSYVQGTAFPSPTAPTITVS
jgi:hypothetical protein